MVNASSAVVLVFGFFNSEHTPCHFRLAVDRIRTMAGQLL